MSSPRDILDRVFSRYGPEVIEKLKQKSRQTVKLSDNDYRTLTEFFNRQIKKL